MTHEPLHPPATFQELPSLGLKSFPESNTLTRLRRKASCCLLAWMRGPQGGPWLERSPGLSFVPGLFSGLVILAPLGVRHCVSALQELTVSL